MWHLVIAFVVCVVIAAAAMWLSFKLPVKKEPEEIEPSEGTALLVTEPPVSEEPTSPPAEPQS